MKTLIIIPAYNEQDNIVKVTQNLKENYPQYDYIVINDGSSDNTENMLESNNIPHISLIRNLGIGGAVQTGYKYAEKMKYDAAVQFDGDGQHDAAYIEKLIAELNSGFDMVIGSRFIKSEESEFKSSAARRAGIRIISALIKILTGKRIYDPTSGFRACNKAVISHFASNYPTEYPEPVSEVTALKLKFKISETPVNMHERQGGRSSIHTWKSIYYMINVTLAMILESLKRY